MTCPVSNLVFSTTRGEEVRTLIRKYFQLHKLSERRLYELAHKHCGHQPNWQIGLDRVSKEVCTACSTSRMPAPSQEEPKLTSPYQPTCRDSDRCQESGKPIVSGDASKVSENHMV